MSRTHRTLRTALLVAAAILAMASFVGIAMNVWVRVASWSDVFERTEDVPKRSYAIVLGASVYSDGRPTEALRHRLDAALELYEAGTVERILITGSSESPYYDETGSMRRWLLDRKVPEGVLVEDKLGVRTLDSMVRAARIFHVKDAVICTQGYHLPRALFLAQRAGLEAIGLDAGAGQEGLSLYDASREFLARIRAFVDAYILRTEPRSMESGAAS